MKKAIFILAQIFFAVFAQNILGQAPVIQRLGPNYFSAGIPSISFYSVAEISGRQRCPEWCWAASCQMVLNFHGLYVTQEQVVNKIYGSLECQPGTDEEILAALTGWAPDARGRYSEIYSEAGLISPVDIVRNLSYQWPLIVALNNPDGSGHAEVMTGVYYSVDQY
jgi:Papain-like cysteine protease AvrRpt2